MQQALIRLTHVRDALCAAGLDIAWEEKPSTYFVCPEDLAIPAELQRQRASPSARLVDFRSGHRPFLPQPEAFLQSIAAEIHAIA